MMNYVRESFIQQQSTMDEMELEFLYRSFLMLKNFCFFFSLMSTRDTIFTKMMPCIDGNV